MSFADVHRIITIVLFTEIDIFRFSCYTEVNILITVKDGGLITTMSTKKKMLTKEEKQKKATQRLYFFVMVSFILPIGYLIVRLITWDGDTLAGGYRSRGDYSLMLVQCLLGVIVMHIPSILAKRFRFQLPMLLYSLYIIFLYCAIFLGEVRSFYYLVPHWDVILHSMSSCMAGLFGVMVIQILNRDEHIVFRLSPFFVAMFSFCFAVSIGAVWEIYEFSFDGLLGLNMQKFLLADGTALVGRAALQDTMKDIIVDTIGALVASCIGYFVVKHEKNWLTAELVENDDKVDTKNAKKD